MSENKMETIVKKRTNEVLGDIRKLQFSVEEIPTAFFENRTDEFKSISADAVLRSEAIACMMRHFLYHCAVERKPQYLVKAAEMQGMSISEHDGMYEIVLPCLLPKRKSGMGSEYLIDPLYYMLAEYTRAHTVKLFKDVVVCFVHEYNKALPDKRIMDYDNMEQKLVMDVISAFLMYDDSGLFCDMYNTTVLGDSDKTRIFIMAPEQFSMWYLGYKQAK